MGQRAEADPATAQAPESGNAGGGAAQRRLTEGETKDLSARGWASHKRKVVVVAVVVVGWARR
jgi:hypothetical protein